jgi:hypothetical protein
VKPVGGLHRNGEDSSLPGKGQALRCIGGDAIRQFKGETAKPHRLLRKLTRMKLTVAGMEGAEKVGRPTPLQARAQPVRWVSVA